MCEQNETPDDAARRAALVRDLLEQLADGWTVVSATVKADERGWLHAEGVNVEEGVSLSPEPDAGKFARGDSEDDIDA